MIKDPITLRELANEYEKRAKEYRLMADSLERTQITSIERSKQLWSCGQKALDLIENGMPENLAVGKISTVMNVTPESVYAHMERLQKKRKLEIAEIRSNTAKSLKEDGQSVRQIAHNMNISKSTAHRLMHSIHKQS